MNQQIYLSADVDECFSHGMSRATTQPSSAKDVGRSFKEGIKGMEAVCGVGSKSQDLNLDSEARTALLNELILGYFQQPLVAELRSSRGPTCSPLLALFQAMHRTQQQIKAAIQNNLEVDVRIPTPIFLTSRKPLLVIDLDETLIHSMAGRQKGDHVFSLYGRANSKVTFTVIIRPFALEFLRSIKEHFTLVLFTASEKAYADKCLELLDPRNEFFTLRLYKTNCLNIDNKFNIKDLRIFRNVPISDILILDNNPICYLLQPGNAIPVVSFFGGSEDTELKKLASILSLIAPLENKLEAVGRFFYKQAIERAERFDELVSSILEQHSDFSNNN